MGGEGGVERGSEAASQSVLVKGTGEEAYCVVEETGIVSGSAVGLLYCSIHYGQVAVALLRRWRGEGQGDDGRIK